MTLLVMKLPTRVRILHLPKQIMQTDANAKAMLEKWMTSMSRYGRNSAKTKRYMAYIKSVGRKAGRP
jgi:hypothetical protein